MSRQITYGVVWENWQQIHKKEGNEIHALMQNRFNSSRQSEFWPSYIYSDKFGDWSGEDALISMRQAIKGESPAEILDFFYNELVAITEILKNHLKTP